MLFVLGWGWLIVELVDALKRGPGRFSLGNYRRAHGIREGGQICPSYAFRRGGRRAPGIQKGESIDPPNNREKP